MCLPEIIRTDIKIQPDASRVLIRPFIPSEHRIVKILARIASQSDEEVDAHLQKILVDFSSRHIQVEKTFLSRYESIRAHQFTDVAPNLTRRMLIGAYFTSEFSLESSALFNPSIVIHPDQSHLESGSVRFIMSLRAVGEGHLSSITFRTGIIDAHHRIKMIAPTRFVNTPVAVTNSQFSSHVLRLKCMDMGFRNEYSDTLFDMLPDTFTMMEVDHAIKELHNLRPAFSMAHANTIQNLKWIIKANYEVAFEADIPLDGRCLFPNSPSEKHGIEDARFVRFVDDDQSVTYYATATAWDGKNMLSQIIETEDFQAFKIRTLNGEAVQNKGMALFPRKLHGKYVMLGRQDNEYIHLMYSFSPQFWRDSQCIVKPAQPWEYYQIGNCGSPLETEEGWLVITHGVGAMRRYAIGAVLLDLEDPSRVIGRTESPLLVPMENEREGYVPNTVYSCGSMIHNGKLILPYAMSDYASRIAMVDVSQLITCLKKGG